MDTGVQYMNVYTCTTYIHVCTSVMVEVHTTDVVFDRRWCNLIKGMY